MNDAAITCYLEEAAARERRWLEEDIRRANALAAFESEMLGIHLAMQAQAERTHHWMLYLMFNPAPDPVTAATILTGGTP